MCVSVLPALCLYTTCMHPWRPEERGQVPGTGVTGGDEQLWVLGTKLGAQQEQPVLLTTGTFQLVSKRVACLSFEILGNHF